MSGHVLPAFSEYQARHRRSRNAHFSGKVNLPFTCGYSRAEMADPFLCQFGAPMVFASRQLFRVACKITSIARRNFSPTLLAHVLKVALCGSEKQMAGTNAAGIVAVMTHPQSIWNRAAIKSPAKAVGSVVPSSADVDLAVALSEPSASPHPALSEFHNVCEQWSIDVDLAPKANADILLHSHRRASSYTLRFRGQGRSGVTSTLAARSFYHKMLSNYAGKAA